MSSLDVLGELQWLPVLTCDRHGLLSLHQFCLRQCTVREVTDQTTAQLKFLTDLSSDERPTCTVGGGKLCCNWHQRSDCSQVPWH